MSHRRKRLSRGVLRYAALILLSALFVAPGAWLVLTSFKEDRDIVITDWTSLLPRITETRTVKDPAAPAFLTTYQGRDVVVRAVSPDQPRLFEVIEPKGLRSQIVERDPATLTATAMKVNVIRTDGRSVVGVRSSVLGSQLSTLNSRLSLSGGRGVVLEDRPDGSIRARMDSGELRVLAAGTFERERRLGLRLENYPDALDYMPEGTNRGLVYLRNTLTLALMGVIGTLLSSSLAAYAFARLHFRGKNLLFGLLLSTLLLPGGVTLLPQFLIFRNLGWIDSLLPLWVPAFLGSAFNIFILRQFFASIPSELEDSARIDGCTPLRSYWSIMLPQVKPALIVIGVWTFIGSWNNFMGPLVYISSPENMPLSYALQLFHSEHGGDPTLEAAFALMMLLPVIAVFFAAQKQIMENAALSGMGGR